MTAKAKILLVDDNAEVRSLFRRVLVAEEFRVIECDDGIDALKVVQAEAPALIILDVEMPRQNGWKTLAQLREGGATQPVLMLTHVNDVNSRIHGLEAGADDYLGKPCDPAELLARVRALLRRVPAPRAKPTRLHLGDVQIDLAQKTASRDGKPVQLTRTEYKLIEILVQHAGRPVSRELLLERLWGSSSGQSHTVDTHLWRLRKKIGDNRTDARSIRNLPGIGYVLTIPAEESAGE